MRIQNKLNKKINESLGNDQFGFRKSIGTREAILRIKLEKQIRRNKDTFIAFVVLENAFDNVQ